MSHLELKAYPGVGKYNQKHFNYSQTVRIGDMVYISGQGGWKDGNTPQTVWLDGYEAQIDQAFKNVEIALKDAGASMENVFKLVTYTVDLTEDLTDVYVAATRKWLPHAPLWTDLGVPKLGDEKMLVEVEVIAHIPQSK